MSRSIGRPSSVFFSMTKSLFGPVRPLEKYLRNIFSYDYDETTFRLLFHHPSQFIIKQKKIEAESRKKRTFFNAQTVLRRVNGRANLARVCGMILQIKKNRRFVCAHRTLAVRSHFVWHSHMYLFAVSRRIGTHLCISQTMDDDEVESAADDEARAAVRRQPRQ